MNVKAHFNIGDAIRIDEPRAMHEGMTGTVYALYPSSLALHFKDADETKGVCEYALYYPGHDWLTVTKRAAPENRL